MSLALQPVLVATSERGDGLLVFNDGWLVAVLVRLSDLQEENAGRWFLESGYGPLDTNRAPTFGDLDAAQAWIADRLAVEVSPPHKA